MIRILWTKRSKISKKKTIKVKKKIKNKKKKHGTSGYKAIKSRKSVVINVGSIIAVTDITQFVEQTTWSGSDTEAGRQLEIQLVRDPYDSRIKTPAIAKGDILEMYYGSTRLFFGHTTSIEMTGEKGAIQIIAKDLLYNLLHAKISQKYKNRTPEYITRAVCAKVGIKTGSLTKTKVRIKKHYGTENPAYNVIMSAYHKASGKTGTPYFPYMDGANLCVKEKGAIIGRKSGIDDTFVIGESVGITSTRATTNVNNMVNRVVIYNGKGKQVGAVSNKDWIAMYGIMQETQINGKKSEARRKLKGSSRTLEIEALGDVRCIAGAGVNLKDPVSGTKGVFWIASDSHTFSAGKHTMNLTMTFSNRMENAEMQYSSGKRNSGYTYKTRKIVKGKRINGMRFTAYMSGEGGTSDMRGRRLNWRERTVACDRLLRMYGRRAYGMKVYIGGTGLKMLDGKVWTNRDTGTGNNHTVDVLVGNRAQENRWPNPHGYIIVGYKVITKRVRVKTGSGSSLSGKRAKIVRAAKSWIGKGVRYRLGGENLRPHGESDCAWFTKQCYRAAGISLPRTTYEQRRRGKHVKKSQLRPGDLIMMNTIGTDAHVGIYLGGGRMIHCGTQGIKNVSIMSGYYHKVFHYGVRVIKD